MPIAKSSATVTTSAAVEEKEITKNVSYPILLCERIGAAVNEADAFKSECFAIITLAEKIHQMLVSTRNIILAPANQGCLYERPIERIVAEVSKVLEKTLTLVRKCRRGNVLLRALSIISASDFKKLQALLENSFADMSWLLNIFDGGGGITLSLPPFASNDPIIGWVWGPIASLYMGQVSDKAEAANQLASLAKDNDRNKKYIVEEGGIPPLLKLLKENSSIDVQIAVATALLYVVNDEERVCAIISELGVPIIVHALGDSPMKVQIIMANLVARMAEHSSLAKEDFARENVIRPLVTLLSIDTFVDEPSFNDGNQSFHAIVEINKQKERNQLQRPASGSSLSTQSSSNGSSRGGYHKKERDNETPELKLELKISCAHALWRLAKGSVLNSRRITETKGLLCLAKLVEKEQGELLFNSLMTIMEITSAAESNVDLRRAAFKTNSLAAKAVVDQLLRVIKGCDYQLQILAMRAIGSLARTFPARETRIIGPLVEQLDHRNRDVATEAVIALEKFACGENFLHEEHSRSIIEFNGVLRLMKLLKDLKSDERAKYHGLTLLCYLTLNVRNIEGPEQQWVLNTLKGAMPMPRDPKLRELITEALGLLNVYHSGVITEALGHLNVFHSGVLHPGQS